ncbi:MAG: MotA/TolQ/ExbB proton channel family protein [Deltaproteobacteria bacterium]|nr:MotA/TolQ/ExbB proton channel family protein [Deltaproteobacteria bacterium]
MIGDLFLQFALLGAEWVLWLLLLLSVISVAVMVDRWRFYRRRRVDIDDLTDKLQAAIADDETDGLDEDFGANQALPAQVALAGVRAAGDGAQVAGEAMNRVKARGRREYEKLQSVLGTLGSNAPFIGLFGTVLGIVGAFNKLSNNPEGGIDVVGGDLSEALVATAIGILVAVPAVIAFNLFNRRMRAALAATDEIAHGVLSAIHARSREDS